MRKQSILKLLLLRMLTMGLSQIGWSLDIIKRTDQQIQKKSRKFGLIFAILLLANAAMIFTSSSSERYIYIDNFKILLPIFSIFYIFYIRNILKNVYAFEKLNPILTLLLGELYLQHKVNQHLLVSDRQDNC